MRHKKIELLNADSVTLLLESSKPLHFKTDRSVYVKKVVTEPQIEETPKKVIEFNPVYRYDLEGNLVDKYLNGHQMAKKLGWKYVTINLYASEERIYKRAWLLSHKNYTKEKASELIDQKREVKPKYVKKPHPKKPKIEYTPKEKEPKEPYIQIDKIYQYNSEGTLVGTYDNAALLSKAIGLNHNTCVSYARQKRVCNGFLLSRETLTPPQVKQRFTDSLKASQVTYIYDSLGVCVFYSTKIMEVRDYLECQLTSKQISKCKEFEKIYKGYMISGKYYTVETAREKYSNGMTYKPYK